MALVPLRYSIRSLWVRKSSTLLTVAAIAATVGVLAAMLSLEQGFSTLFQQRGRADLAVFLRQGATSESESGITREQTDILVKETPEIEQDQNGQPIAAAEMFLAILREKIEGGKTNVAIRGVQPMTFTAHGDDVRILPGGRNLQPGADELIVGQGIAERIANCQVGDEMVINVTPFKIVGIFEGKGGYRSEIWGDLDRLGQALQRSVHSRVLARVKPGTDVAAIQTRMASDRRIQPVVSTERDYLGKQTSALSATFATLGIFLAILMGIAAVFTGTNAMLSAVAARTAEVGILKAIGFRPGAIFLAFVFEAIVLGVLGGALGCAVLLPLQGLRTGTSNPASFSEVTFAFTTTPFVLAAAITFAAILGLIGGSLPALRAARMAPTTALRRG